LDQNPEGVDVLRPIYAAIKKFGSGDIDGPKTIRRNAFSGSVDYIFHVKGEDAAGRFAAELNRNPYFRATVEQESEEPAAV